jgi:hypothetical protein
MFDDNKEVIESIDDILHQALRIIESRTFDLGIVRVYNAGGTLCIDINNNTSLAYLVMVNISNETYTVNSLSDKSEQVRLLPIDSLRLAFRIYEKIKGKNNYYNECFNNSCLRHL